MAMLVDKDFNAETLKVSQIKNNRNLIRLRY